MPAMLVVAGAIVAAIAVVQASAGVLVVAGVLFVAGIVVAAVVAQRRVQQPGRRVALVAGLAVLAAAILVPASMNVDPCTRIGSDADLSGCDLSGQDLAGENLRAADLTGADLSGANLAGAELVGASLDRANLGGTNLSGARLEDATATDANLRGADLSNIDLSDADLTGADVREVKAPDAVLSRATLADADLTGSTLSGVSLDAADLSGADLTGSTLSGVSLNGANLSGADLTEAVLDTAELPDATLSGATLVSSDLTGADLSGADLTGADLTSADLSQVRAPGAVFDDAVLTEASLRSNDFAATTGLTDESLAAALGVPTGQLPAETMLRGIVFDPYDAILEAVTPVGDGQAIPESRTYPRNDAFHPTIVLDADDIGTASWLADVRDQWAPTGIRYAELVVVVLPESQRSVELCTGYVFDDGRAAPPINRYVRTVTVRVLSAHNARAIAERTFEGSTPRRCQAEEFLSTIAPSLSGNPPNLDSQAQPWLADLVNPPATRPT